MKNHQLEAFYQVMLTGSISQAARNLGRTQPAVSMTINTLEEHLGVRLFDRGAGRIRPRTEATILFERLRPVMEQLRDIQQTFSGKEGFANPRLSIIAANNVGTHLIPSCIAHLGSDKHPVRIMNGSAARIVSEIESQSHDIALADEGYSTIPMESPLYEAERFEVQIYALFRRGLLGPVGSTVSTNELRGQRICSVYSEHRVSRKIASFTETPIVEFQNFFPMACYALRSESVALVDYITCTTIAALTGPDLQADWRPLSGGFTSVYYLLRPSFRPRSEFGDLCYQSIRNAMLEHSYPYKDG